MTGRSSSGVGRMATKGLFTSALPPHFMRGYPYEIKHADGLKEASLSWNQIHAFFQLLQQGHSSCGRHLRIGSNGRARLGRRQAPFSGRRVSGRGGGTPRMRRRCDGCGRPAVKKKSFFSAALMNEL